MVYNTVTRAMKYFILIIVIVVGLGTAVSAHAAWVPIQPRGPEPKPVAQKLLEAVLGVQTEVQPGSAEAPAQAAPDKRIVVSLKDQDLKYFEDNKLIGEFKISSGIKGRSTPAGEFEVLAKKPFVDYIGPDYNYPHTKWNLQFKKGQPLGYYIHGVYWHKNFGHPMSHGCINVSYADMEPLYNWADVGTKISIE